MRRTPIPLLRHTLRLSATSNPGVPTDAQIGKAVTSLLPPLPLYRRILRLHRLTLPTEMRSLGDTYVKDEFRRHRAIDNPLQIVGFLSQWKRYLDEMEASKGMGLGFEGRRIDPEVMDKLSEEQLYQLYEVFQATSELFDPSKAQAQPPGGNEAVQEAVGEALQKVRERRRGGGGKGEGEGQ